MKIKKVAVNAFGGINPASPVILDFTQANWIKVSGDFGLGKSSVIDAFLTACGMLSKDDKDKINLDSGKIDLDMEFVGTDRITYNVRVTKSAFKLTYAGENVSEPISKMRQLLGSVGITPMVVKEKPLKDIVKWLAAYSNKSPEEFDKAMLKFKEGIKAAESSRADANRSLKGLNEYLSAEPMFINWEKSEKTYTKDVDVKKLSAELTAAGKDSDTYLRAEQKLENLKDNKTTYEIVIEQLKKSLEEKEKQLAECNKNIEVGEAWLKENVSMKTNYDSVKKRYDSAALDKAHYDKWQAIKAKKKERDDFETLSQQFDAKAKDLIRQRKEKQAEILPDIKGLELVTDEYYEDGRKYEEGFYYQGKNVRQLSTTEWWSLVMQIWIKQKVRVVVIDEYQDLGSYGVELLQKLEKAGAFILTAEMNREQKELMISYE